MRGGVVQAGVHYPRLLRRSQGELVEPGTAYNPLKGISAEFQVIRGFSQKIPADLLSYDKIHG